MARYIPGIAQFKQLVKCVNKTINTALIQGLRLLNFRGCLVKVATGTPTITAILTEVPSRAVSRHRQAVKVNVSTIRPAWLTNGSQVPIPDHSVSLFSRRRHPRTLVPHRVWYTTSGIAPVSMKHSMETVGIK